MTNYHAIATVTAALHNILSSNLTPLSGVTVTAKPLDQLEQGGVQKGLNLFLYNIVKNTGFQYLDSPTHNSKGELVKTPVLSLNLFYLLTAYTKDSDELQDIQRQQFLAKAMIALNENPVITRERIRKARLASLEIPDIDTGDHLDNQVELVKVSLHPLSSEEMTKLWSSFFQTHYRLSVAYVVTVVLLDSKKEIVAGLPVQERKLYVFPYRESVIDKIEPQIVERTDGAKIKLIGQNLLADKVKVLFDTEYTIIPKPEDTSDTQIIVELPKELTAGIKQVQVIHPMVVGDPAVEHENWAISNIAAFVLAPRIVSKSPTTSFRRGKTLTLTVDPGVTDKQKVEVFVGRHMFDVKIPATPGAVVKTLPPITIRSDFHLTGTKELFLLRVRIDGADSFVKRDDKLSTPTHDVYVPFVEITK